MVDRAPPPPAATSVVVVETPEEMLGILVAIVLYEHQQDGIITDEALKSISARVDDLYQDARKGKLLRTSAGRRATMISPQEAEASAGPPAPPPPPPAEHPFVLVIDPYANTTPGVAITPRTKGEPHG